MPRTSPSSKNTPARKTSARSISKDTELLLEIGTEELPYQFIAPALRFLHEGMATMLQEHRLSFGQIRTMGTPRRLVVMIDQLATQQQSAVKEAMGPSKSVAFDQAGHPTKAAIGFAAAQGVPVEALQVRQTAKGEYVCAVKEEKGQSTTAVLTHYLPGLIGKLSFPKAMQWNDTGVRFARPVRWLVALCGGKTLPIEFAGVTAGRISHGHRFGGAGMLSPKKGFVVTSIQQYLEENELYGVLVDQEQRKQLIMLQLLSLAKSVDGRLNLDRDLLEQAVYTVEYPNTILGSFEPQYLSLPKEVLITSMKEHQGYFSILDKTDILLPYFLAVTNVKLPDMQLIRKGNERVLAARLADARFFFEEDKKIELADRVKNLSEVTYHQGLKTLHHKTTRIVDLATWLASKFELSHDDTNFCRKAAQLSKADLITGMVGEFPSLQGVMGAEYAKHDGEEEQVCKAIRDQYLPRGMEADLPETIHGKVVSLADRLDTIVAFFRAGIIPKGSEDPYALRRNALSIVRIIIEGNLRLDLHQAVDMATEIVQRDIGDTSSMLSGDPLSFIFERFRFYAGTTRKLRDDVVAAVSDTAYADTSLDLVDVLQRAMALQSISAQPDFDPLIVGFKRAHRLVQKENWTRDFVREDLLEHPAERELFTITAKAKEQLLAAIAKHEYSQGLATLVQMKPVIDNFFEGVLVNAEENNLRENRLSLLYRIDHLFRLLADFSHIVVQGS